MTGGDDDDEGNLAARMSYRRMSSEGQSITPVCGFVCAGSYVT